MTNEKPASPTTTAKGVTEALRQAYDFLGKVQGVTLGVAMSGSDHPDPDGALMELFRDAQEQAESIRATLSALDRTTLPPTEGMVLVPRDPSEAFISACLDEAECGNLSGLGWAELYRNVYRVAVAAAAPQGKRT